MKTKFTVWERPSHWQIAAYRRVEMHGGVPGIGARCSALMSAHRFVSEYIAAGGAL
jgi:hypothetical protein